ncbi:MAG: hypothetical protein A2268_07745 [Candidatus Raymondbacteria bacterium RifOxyA12_full_50_37]|uniref:Uncharacterized protein n=1 Tax=Candidatus Raymondbacteria bacterium RIFOXYD12_FULL_49_13 TaxID=1817890 RepID=A0A1F7F4Y5_UNCRA|nr:MAG: hypothetical protein A2248_05355 [Candidatus Raymondbacteria bacterium RIFOXYA2_FULL_49_16]OGJ90133.1 MAG: hypothetical protein A2268_07745 [Candidatus Raymondbacteria bacterium RifOxyA12_full_50_37]OGJ92121.1 MAG: hypothetical protein A2350_08605 [Candidatus Raymondbacteria bacterium RifOxyB12_full_50_8]OGJ97711.1 MAG: hypothetical protein A2453_09715 [Candidatus Raymondbacteria bacterium RIFOXYC2_FULL_50_21]OGK01724.1 MAG: hypothetical protein A2519_22900 [Candidatus Raymondbacteria b
MKKKLLSIATGLLMAAIFWGCNEARIKTTFEEIVLRSDRIVLAQAISKEICWNQDSSSLNTFIKFYVVADIEGETQGDDIMVKFFEGAMGQQCLTLLKQSRGNLGSEAFLFLNRDPACDSCYEIMGMYQNRSTVSFKRMQERGSAVIDGKAVAFFARMNGNDMVVTGYNIGFDELKRVVSGIRAKFAAR